MVKKECESLKHAIRRGFILKIDGEYWISKNDKRGSLLKINHCPFSGKALA